MTSPDPAPTSVIVDDKLGTTVPTLGVTNHTLGFHGPSRDVTKASVGCYTNDQRMAWLHQLGQGNPDAEGYEWGIYRVKWKGELHEVWQTNTDLSDLDAAMRAGGVIPKG